MRQALAVLLGGFPVMFLGVSLSFGLAQTQQQWEITGTVTSDSGPVKNAGVDISGPSYFPRVQTDGLGRYSIKGTVPGRYSIGLWIQDNASVPRPRTVSLAAGARLNVDFRLPKGGVISGRVLDGNKRPVRDMVVRALSKTVNGDMFWLREQGSDLTNDLGEYRIAHLPDGVYVVGVIRRDTLRGRERTSGSEAKPGTDYPAVTFHPSTRVSEAAATLEVRSGDELPDVEIVLRKEATRCVSFRVGGGWDTPRFDVTLEERLSGHWVTLATIVAKPSGLYEFCGVTAGEYRVHLSKVAVNETRRLQVLGYQMAALTMGDENVDLGTLEPLARADVRGTVIVKDSASGDSIPAGIRVSAAPWEMHWMYAGQNMGQVEPGGAFVLSKVFLGEYGVRVNNLPAGYYVIGASQQGKDVLERGMWPGSGDLKITLGADGATVTGRVLAADGGAIPDTPVLLVPKGSGKHLVGRSDQAGVYQFSFGVLPGEYRVVAAPDLPGWQQQDSATAARSAANGTEVKLGSRESRTVDLKIPSIR